MNKLYLGIIFLVLIISVTSVSAYTSHKQNTNFDLVVQSNNATTCNVTYIQFPDGVNLIINKVMTKTGNTFNYTLNSNNFTQLGDSCIGVSCSDGTIQETGSICRSITPSGSNNILGFFILIIVVIYAIAFVGFFGKNPWVAMLGGMAMLGLGLFTINNGVDIFRNQITEIFSWTTIGLGAFFALYSGVAVIQENYN